MALVSAAADDMRRNTSERTGRGKVEVLKTAPNLWSVYMRNEGFANFSPATIVVRKRRLVVHGGNMRCTHGARCMSNRRS